MSDPEGPGVDCEIVSPSNVRSYTHNVSPTWLPRHELVKVGISRHAEVGGERP